MLTNKQIDNRVKKLQDIEAQIKELTEQAEAIRDEIKHELDTTGETERQTDNFLIRWTEYITRRIDSKALKAALPDVWATYSSESISRRFSIA